MKIVYQDLHDLPNSFSCPEDRSKPWGTGQAILAARNVISEPFAAINGDDFYGRESFKIISDYYSSVKRGFAMAAFQLDKTLSDHGSVSRGICEQNLNELVTVVETHGIKKSSAGNIECDRDISLLGNELVSMNMWGFMPSLFDHLEKYKHMINNKVSSYDCLISPSALGEALNGLEYTGSPVLNTTWTLLGLPSITLPMFTSKNNLPIGCQFISKKADDNNLLSISKKILSEFS